MQEVTPPDLRSIRPPYRLRPRSAVTLMSGDEESSPGVIERLRSAARRILSQAA